MLKDSAIGSSSQTAGAHQNSAHNVTGILTVQDLDTDLMAADYPEKARQIIENSQQTQDRTSRLLQQVDNFVSDRESSSIAMGTSATSNPPSLVTQSHQPNSPRNLQSKPFKIESKI